MHDVMSDVMCDVVSDFISDVVSHVMSDVMSVAMSYIMSYHVISYHLEIWEWHMNGQTHKARYRITLQLTVGFCSLKMFV